MRNQTFYYVLMSLFTVLALPFMYSCGGSDDDRTDSGNDNNKGGDKPTVSTEYVDLGLSVKWATCNLGAKNPWEYGEYFSWGETTPKETYSVSNYKFFKLVDGYDDRYRLTKYCFNSAFNNISDNKWTLDPQDDAASVMLGEKWRLPTIRECKELLEECTWSWTTINGIGGYNVKGKNGNSIFLPAAGFYNNKENNSIGDYGRYWANSIEGEYEDTNGVTIRFYSPSHDSDPPYLGARGRCYGQTIRPVHP